MSVILAFQEAGNRILIPAQAKALVKPCLKNNNNNNNKNGLEAWLMQ
jgi:hypothetical protein